jgi:hypothetical protein
MSPPVLCPRHGHTDAVLACDHVSLAVSSDSDPPPYRRLRVSVDQGEAMSCCACFACMNRFGLTSGSSVSLDANPDESKFPKIHPLCVKCLELAHSPRAADLAAIRDPTASPVQRATAAAAMVVSIPQGRPSQVSAAVLLLFFSLGIGAVSSIHAAPPYLLGGLFVVVFRAWLAYNIWIGRYWARGTYAVIFGLGVLAYVLSAGEAAKISILQRLLELVALYLLFTNPGRSWFVAESPVP